MWRITVNGQGRELAIFMNYDDAYNFAVAYAQETGAAYVKIAYVMPLQTDYL